MSSLLLCTPAWPDVFARITELRVDVIRPPQQVRDELHDLGCRLARPVLNATEAKLPEGFVARERHAAGDVFVYVEEVATARLVGYVAFQRLAEAGRRATDCVRLPHALFHPDFQRRGLGTAVYGAILARGIALVSGARQSRAAHALWQALGRQHTLGHVRLGRRQLTYLGPQVSESVLDDLQTRLLLLPARTSLPAFAQRTGMVGALP